MNKQLYQNGIHAAGQLFSKDWLNGPHSRNRDIFGNWAFASEGVGGGGDMD